MPKRACPFDYDLPPQLKYHVRQKEVDNGVSRDSRMKKVYDHTLNLLKEGAKELSNRLNESTDLDFIQLPVVKMPLDAKSKSQRSLKQMFLGSNLQLETTDKIDKDAPIELCECCRVIDRNESNQCSYCDQMLCSSCLAECTKCSRHYCRNCSLVVYDNEEHILCLNCYY